MSSHANGKRSTATTRHSKEDALDDREFERLLAATHRLDPGFALQSRTAILLAGRLGMRAGEIAHLKADWVDWRRNMIVIPAHHPCEDGRDGGPCGYCRNRAEEQADHNPGLSYEQALAGTWSPKTQAAAREIPFDSDTRATLAVEEFFDVHDEWPTSRQGVNRRVDRAAREAHELDEDDVYPHCLRATAASRFAASGLDVFSLRSVMGWSQISTAMCYIQASGERTAKAIRDAGL